MPTGRVKWYDEGKGFGFLTRDEGGDVFVPKGSLPAGVAALTPGQRVEFGIAQGRRGDQALQVKLVEAPASMAELRRRSPDELHGLVEDMIKVLELKVQPDLQRGRYPDKKSAAKIAEIVHAVANELAVGS